MVVVSFWNYLEHFVQKDSSLLLSGVTDFSESYNERELLWKIVNFEELERQL